MGIKLSEKLPAHCKTTKMQHLQRIHFTNKNKTSNSW